MSTILDRIVFDQKVLVGKPVIKGTRLSVQFIIGLLGNGMSMEDILSEYTYITQDDINACLLYAAKTLDTNTFVPLKQVA